MQCTTKTYTYTNINNYNVNKCLSYPVICKEGAECSGKNYVYKKKHYSRYVLKTAEHFE